MMVILSDGGQTHRRCTFLCAPSRSVYSVTQSSSSNCLRVCPWWEYNDSRPVCAPVGRKQRGHIVPQPVSALHGPSDCFFPSFFFFPKHNLRNETGAGGEHVCPREPAAVSGRSAARTVKSLIVPRAVRPHKGGHERHGRSDFTAGWLLHRHGFLWLPQSRPHRLPFHKNALIKGDFV